MRIDISTRDKTWCLVFLLNLLYFFVLHASGCTVSDAPLGFVRDCHNHGIDWNAFMAPAGVVMIVALPLSVAYWLLRIACTMFKASAYLAARFLPFR